MYRAELVRPSIFPLLSAWTIESEVRRVLMEGNQMILSKKTTTEQIYAFGHVLPKGFLN